jgi:O-antigen/teichoic acid export membrane protein
LGLAFHVGTGAMVTVVIGLFLFRGEFDWKGVIPSLRIGVQFLRETFLSSVVLTWGTFVVSWGQLSYQLFFKQKYGIGVFGNYTAAFALIDVALLVLMASVRGYFLSQFRECRNTSESRHLMKNMISLLLGFASLGIVVLVFLSKFIIAMLYTKEFVLAVDLLKIFSLSFIPMVFCWTYNTFLLFRGEHRLFTAIDSVWILSLAGLGFGLTRMDVSPQIFAWIYSLSGFPCAALYIILTCRKYGKEFFIPGTVLFGIASTLFTIGIISIKM